MDLTQWGREVRKFRLDHNHTMKELAELLDVTAAFLSAVETGRKSVPESLNKKISKVYTLSTHQLQSLNELALKQHAAMKRDQVRIDLSGATKAERELAVSFARKFTELTEEKKQALEELLKKE